jgi:hypothetical protein
VVVDLVVHLMLEEVMALIQFLVHLLLLVVVEVEVGVEQEILMDKMGAQEVELLELTEFNLLLEVQLQPDKVIMVVM